MPENIEKYQIRPVESLIRTMRGQKVILDRDLAALYAVTTVRFNQAIKRNRNRFPGDFCFQLNRDEFLSLISQNVISNQGRGGVRKLPWVFTEHGALMAANVLNSTRAVEMSVFVIRAFIKLREKLATDAALEKRLEEIEKTLISHDAALRTLYGKIKPLLLPKLDPEPPKRKIGFNAEEKRAKYRA